MTCTDADLICSIANLELQEATIDAASSICIAFCHRCGMYSVVNMRLAFAEIVDDALDLLH